MSFTGPAEDRLMVRELIDAYADAVSRCDAEAWGALWADDAIWSMPDYPGYERIEGRATIVETWIAAMKHYPGIIFVASMGAIDVTNDTATARSYTSEVYDDAAGVTKRDRGTYSDTLVKANGRWLFKTRTFRNIHRA